MAKTIAETISLWTNGARKPKYYFAFERPAMTKPADYGSVLISNLEYFFRSQFVFLLLKNLKKKKAQHNSAQVAEGPRISFPVSWTLCYCCYWHSCCLSVVGRRCYCIALHLSCNSHKDGQIERERALRAPAKQAAALISFLLSWQH